jgi:hypothetical protein
MLGVIIHWDHKRGLDAIGRRNLFQHYDYACRAYAVDKLVIVDTGNTMGLSPPHDVVRTLDEALARFEPGAAVYFVHPKADESLRFHFPPQDVIYIVGADYERLELPEECRSLKIPVADPAIELWADQALAIVLASKLVFGQ